MELYADNRLSGYEIIKSVLIDTKIHDYEVYEDGIIHESKMDLLIQ